MNKLPQQYCLNCNMNTHNSKKCNFGIISNGIISINTNFNIDYDKFEKFFYDNLEKYIDNPIIKHNINDDVKFLLIQRKNSLGYGELVRGHYDHKNIDSINYLFKQMTEKEIEMIKTKTFEELWNYYWNGNGISNPKHLSEFNLSKKKFTYIINTYKNEDYRTSEYNFNEWGFPKGRRELYEDNFKCAIREFTEETNIKNINYILKKKSIQEKLIGTNGIKYIHNYFISFINKNEINNFENNSEIGDIKLMSINECLTFIRPYHTDKINIIKILYNMILDFRLNHQSIIK